ncbi:uncharacterized protein [Procambarus clarkii]|uniref:uncharacterized protein n=1 Tax=Procambarus clarkii TaxID=6728 RepID=UPI0037435705
MSLTELEYVMLTPDHLDDVFQLLVNHFYPRENFTLGLGFSPETKLNMDRQFIRTCLESGLSVGAREKSTRRLIGIMLNSIITADSLPKPTLSTNSTEAEIKYARFSKLKGSLVDIFQDPGVNRVLNLSRGCVHPNYGRRGVMTKLIQMSFDLGIKQSCQLARAGVSSLYTEKALLRLGFKVRAALDFQTLEENLLDLSRMYYKKFKVMTNSLSSRKSTL